MRWLLQSLLTESQETVSDQLHLYHPRRVDGSPNAIDIEWDEGAQSWRLFFRAGRFFATTGPHPLSGAPADTPLWMPWRTRWQTIALSLVIIWMLLVPIVLILWRYRRALAQIMLALAILCAACSSLDSRSDRPLAIEFCQPFFWAAAVMAALSILVGAWPNAQRRRSPYPLCHKCGYNLTGNVSGVCPECGTPIPAVVHANIAERLAAMDTPPPEPGDEAA